MPVQGRLVAELVVRDASGIHLDQKVDTLFTPGLLPNGERLPVVLTASASTTVAVPVGAVCVWIALAGALGLTVKGNAADTGISIAPAANPITGFDCFFPLAAQANLVFTSTSIVNQTVELLFV